MKSQVKVKRDYFSTSNKVLNFPPKVTQLALILPILG